MRTREKMSASAVWLWCAAAVGGLALGVAEFRKYQPGMPHYHQPTPQETKRLDNILRPAAVNAAQAAITLYSEHPLAGFIQKPPEADLISMPTNAVELYVQGRKYSITVDLQRRHKRLDPRTVYDVEIFGNGKNASGVSITAEDYSDNQVDKEFLLAETGDTRTVADLMTEVSDSEVKQAIQDAKKIAAIADEEVATFSGSSS